MSSKYQMWLTHNNEAEKLRFPVLPEEFSVSVGSLNEKVSIVGLGEITIMQNRPAYTFSFSSFFPAIAFPGVETDKITPPAQIAKQLEKWKSSEKPVHFILTGAGINVYCTIESLKFTEKGGDVGSIYYTLSLREYRTISSRQVTTKSGVAYLSSADTRTDNRVSATTYTVKSGDCMWSIAKAQLGDGSRYDEIYQLNKALLDPLNKNCSKYTVYVGNVLALPER